MRDIQGLIQDLVAANRILAAEGLCDAYGHISVRNPDNRETYFLSRSRSPELVVESDILEFNLDNSPTRETGHRYYSSQP